MNRHMQCKDVPDQQILAFLYRVRNSELYAAWQGTSIRAPVIDLAFPPQTPFNLMRAKMDRLIRR
jgi:hypothetical protein